MKHFSYNRSWREVDGVFCKWNTKLMAGRSEEWFPCRLLDGKNPYSLRYLHVIAICLKIYATLNLIIKIINYLFINVSTIFHFLVFDINLFPVTQLFLAIFLLISNNLFFFWNKTDSVSGIYMQASISSSFPGKNVCLGLVWKAFPVPYSW